ncbi:MAG: catalase [Polyangia bacterium]
MSQSPSKPSSPAQPSPSPGPKPTTADDPLAPFKVDNAGKPMTTNQGIGISDNQHSLKQGARGPTLLEDFILREKITHFDHERIPERVVHARGSGAHGYFEVIESAADLTCASFLQKPGARTDVFVRFSTVAGSLGSPDLARDVRGFAIKFYTDQGIWDLVGNNIPVFFIQDAMKFPDLVHSVKPEPHNDIPQAASAHDTFWDFVSQKTESTHMLMWVMSDRALPRSFRMMQGFGVHTFRMVNAQGEAKLVKFHLSPLAGTHSVLWDEAVKINGADPDFHRRDLWESIESGVYPEYRFGVQVFTEEEAASWPFDVLDPTKLVPEELVPVRWIGRLVLNKNPDNFFAETEQVAFCPANIVPGIDFTNDPLLQGRLFSYLDTQLNRFSSPNFHQVPINRSRGCPVHNNQRGGFMQQRIDTGRVAHEPSGLSNGSPIPMGMKGFVTFPAPPEGSKLRADPQRFAEHYAQAKLFWRSQSEIEKAHIVGAFQFELAKVETPEIRERVVRQLSNVDAELAGRVAQALGLPPPEQETGQSPTQSPAQSPAQTLGQSAGQAAQQQGAGAVPSASPALSLFSRPGEMGIKGRRIAVLLADGVEAEGLSAVREALTAKGAVVKLVAPRLGTRTARDEELKVDHTLRTSPSLLYDAVVLAGGQRALSALRQVPQAIDFVRDAYLHCKTIGYFGGAEALLEAAGLPLRPGDLGLVQLSLTPTAAETAGLVRGIELHRHFERELIPPG